MRESDKHERNEAESATPEAEGTPEERRAQARRSLVAITVGVAAAGIVMFVMWRFGLARTPGAEAPPANASEVRAARQRPTLSFAEAASLRQEIDSTLLDAMRAMDANENERASGLIAEAQAKAAEVPEPQYARIAEALDEASTSLMAGEAAHARASVQNAAKRNAVVMARDDLVRWLADGLREAFLKVSQHCLGARVALSGGNAKVARARIGQARALLRDTGAAAPPAIKAGNERLDEMLSEAAAKAEAGDLARARIMLAESVRLARELAATVAEEDVRAAAATRKGTRPAPKPATGPSDDVPSSP